MRKTAVLQTQAFRAQVNPHFIHSALESINEFVQANESDLASSFLTRFARLMRAVLENARLDEVSLQRDLDVLRDYLELERTRTQNRFSYTIIVDPNIDQEEVLVPPMLLQPFAEEAIWKDLAQQVNGSISITVSKVDDALLMTVQDNGEQTGSGTTVMTETGSDHGVSITKARLELYQQTERRPATLRWTPLTVGHKVEVLLPWRIAA
ncbi:MAG: histidine kinase [Flavobacteriales bacterium]|nr:histidine kinase [Flavobacteriales bacterium]